jgi:outer membrane receptor for ferrienterochelin and colicin
MTNNKLLSLVGVVLLAFFITALAVPAPLFSQESGEEDIEDFSLEDLLNVEITSAGKKAQKISDIPASVVVITRADIEKYGYVTLDDILEHVPGFYGNNQRDVTGMKFGVRGFWSATANSIITLINGVRQERIGSDGATYMAQHIPIESIDRIEVIRGPMSVIYGTGAFFGVINIVTNDVGEANKSLASVSVGTVETVSATVRGAYQKDDISFVFNGGYFDHGGPDVPYSTMSSFDVTGPDFGGGNATVDGLWGTQFKFFNVSGKFKGFYANITHNIQKKGLDLFFPSASDGAVANRIYSSLSFGYTHKFSDQFSLDGKFTYHSGNVESKWDWFTSLSPLKVGGDFNQRDDYEVDLTGFFTPSKNVNITAGLYYKRIVYEQLQTHVPYIDFAYQIGTLESPESKAAYVQAEFNASQKLSFVAGVRFDQTSKYSVYYNDFSGNTYAEGDYNYDTIEVLPRFAMIYKINEKNILKFFYGKAINHPSIYQTGAQAAAGQAPLNPEFIETFELNFLAVFSEKFSLNASGFYNKLNKLIVNELVVEDDRIFGRNINSGELETFGGELSLNIRPSKKFHLDLSGTYQKTEDKRPGFEDITVAYSPEFLAYAKLTYNITDDISLALLGRYVGEMEPFYDVTIPGRIANSVDGYAVLDANLRFNNLFGKGFYLGIRVSNLLDEEYLYASSTINGFWADKGLIGNGRLLLFTFGKKF